MFGKKEWKSSPQLFSELKEVISLNFCQGGASSYSEQLKQHSFYRYVFSNQSSYLFWYHVEKKINHGAKKGSYIFGITINLMSSFPDYRHFWVLISFFFYQEFYT